MSIVLAHGSGGEKTMELLRTLILSKVPEKLYKTPEGFGLDILDDGACIKVGNVHIVVSIDSYTVNPIFFPGGDLGKLAASGTLNDVVAMGAKPVAVLDAVIIEEGTDMDTVDKILRSFIEVIKEEDVALIGGDLKVMPRGQLDKIVITVAGIGITEKPIIDKNLKSGDKIIVTGPIAEHGVTIMALQQGIDAEKYGLKSDCRCLVKPILRLVEKYGEHIHAMRDPTRGGLATVLNEWARESGKVIIVDEKNIPIRFEVRKFCEIAGIDPMYLACEGVMVISADPEVAENIVEDLRNMGFEYASIIGEVRESEKYRGMVICRTSSSGLRIVEPLRGVLVPRIC